MTNTFCSTLGSTPGANFTTKTVFLEEENQSIKYEIGIQMDRKNIVL